MNLVLKAAQAARSTLPAVMGGLPAALRELGERAGELGGALAAPWLAAGSRLRGDRLLHPSGVVYGARVHTAGEPRTAELASRLAGGALVRLSNGLWRGGDLPDVLGVALRFGVTSERSSRGLQDLLLISSRHIWTIPSAFVTTEQGDFLANTYWSAAPFEAPGLGLVEVRARGAGGGAEGRSRPDRLEAAVARGTAALRLEVRRLRGEAWLPVAEVRLQGRRDDLGALRFDPFLNGAGLEPRGFFNSMRRAAYAASRSGTPREGRR